MSFYRNVIAAVAAMGLATAAFADETTTNAASQNPSASAKQPVAATQVADASSSATPSVSTDAAAPSSAQDKIDLNKASAKELMKVKGMNKSKAVSIVAYRKQHGDFKSLDDLKEVKGFKRMNEKNLKSMESQLTAG